MPPDQMPATGLFIFVNRRKFEEGDGVLQRMTGAQIAQLVEVPADNAAVKLVTGTTQTDVGISETIVIIAGEHFLVTRKLVEGGHEPGTH